MTSYPEDLRLQNQGTFRNDVDDDDDFDLSEEGEFSPEPEDLVQGPMTGYAKRGPQDNQLACASDKKDKKSKSSDKGKSNEPPKVIKRIKTDKPARKPNPDKYK